MTIVSGFVFFQKPRCLALWISSSRATTLVVGCDDGFLRLFNRFSGQLTLKFQTHSTSINALHVPSSLNEPTLSLSGGSDGSIAISNLVQGVVLFVLHEHENVGPIRMFDSKDSHWLATSENGQISLWKTKSNRSFDSSQFVRWLSICSSSLARFFNENLFVSTRDGLEIFDFENEKVLRRFSSYQTCSTLNFIEENRFIVLGTNQRLIQLKDFVEETFQDFLGHSDRICHLENVSSQGFLISCASNEIFVWKRTFSSQI